MNEEDQQTPVPVETPVPRTSRRNPRPPVLTPSPLSEVPPVPSPLSEAVPAPKTAHADLRDKGFVRVSPDMRNHEFYIEFEHGELILFQNGQPRSRLPISRRVAMWVKELNECNEHRTGS